MHAAEVWSGPRMPHAAHTPPTQAELRRRVEALLAVTADVDASNGDHGFRRRDGCHPKWGGREKMSGYECVWSLPDLFVPLIECGATNSSFCQALNREDCEFTPNTCGRCFECYTPDDPDDPDNPDGNDKSNDYVVAAGVAVLMSVGLALLAALRRKKTLSEVLSEVEHAWRGTVSR